MTAAMSNRNELIVIYGGGIVNLASQDTYWLLILVHRIINPIEGLLYILYQWRFGYVKMKNDKLFIIKGR